MKIIRSHLSRSKLLCRCAAHSMPHRVPFGFLCCCCCWGCCCFFVFPFCHLWHDMHASAPFRYINAIYWYNWFKMCAKRTTICRHQTNIATYERAGRRARARQSSRRRDIFFALLILVRRTMLMIIIIYSFTRRTVWIIVFDFYWSLFLMRSQLTQHRRRRRRSHRHRWKTIIMCE